LQKGILALKTIAGARTTRCSGLTAETLITARPRLPCSSFSPPSALKGSAGTGAARFVKAVGRGIAPAQLTFLQRWLLRVGTQAVAQHGEYVVVQQSGVEQFANQKAQPPAAWKWFTSASPFG
jgi:hypothetical protein